MSKVAVPSHDIRHTRGIQGGGMPRNMSDRSGGQGDTVKMMCGRQGASNDRRTAVVGNPAGCAIKVCNIVTAVIKRGNRQEAYLGARDEQDVIQG